MTSVAGHSLLTRLRFLRLSSPMASPVMTAWSSWVEYRGGRGWSPIRPPYVGLSPLTIRHTALAMLLIPADASRSATQEKIGNAAQGKKHRHRSLYPPYGTLLLMFLSGFIIIVCYLIILLKSHSMTHHPRVSVWNLVASTGTLLAGGERHVPKYVSISV